MKKKVEIFAVLCAVEAPNVKLAAAVSWTGQGAYKHRDD
ncbi:MAG: hypothetical protein UU67_C0056G0003 [Candidatus Daviesbacteria bacterium GW2011_GWB1_41_5]|uniref:Uncharacterized protein n=1 Tax=Candidatus Daviesbacteria bacterium GW2011_GWB1_41_5 TaxID=1618429 RepID=A0A0G0YRA8_9BACT|nr:MAG: hypothetical protein UU67_C0056G0003 [Candidatus Daviesbacteria bacterium GW2011_GWB1_41_5]